MSASSTFVTAPATNTNCVPCTTSNRPTPSTVAARASTAAHTSANTSLLTWLRNTGRTGSKEGTERRTPAGELAILGVFCEILNIENFQSAPLPNPHRYRAK